MPRRPRNCPPGTCQHLIFRFLDKRYRFIDDRDRGAYLRLVAEEALRSNWSFVSYALMSNHGHWGALAGPEPLKAVFHRPHSRFAQLWHRRHGGLGPVFADRPKNHRVRAERMGELIAYNHMDPVRNSLVAAPAESIWTSHRAYLRLDPAPPWLDIERGLALCGFDDIAADRARFDEFVRSSERRHWQWDPEEVYAADVAIYLPETARKSQSAPPPVQAIVDHVTGALALPPRSLSRCAGRPDQYIARARRVTAILAVHHHGHPSSEVARVLHVSPQAVCRMLCRGDQYESAARIAAEIG